MKQKNICKRTASGGFTYLYVAALPSHGEIASLGIPERDAEIAAVSNMRVKREKYYAWRLLELAVRDRFGLTLNELGLRREEYGGWSSEVCELSVSHTADAVAVALCDMPVGVDIEEIHLPRASGFAERIMNETEFAEYLLLSECDRTEKLIRIWTAKEAIFKSQHSPAFIPKDTAVASVPIVTDTLMLGEKKYIWSLAVGTKASDRTVDVVPICVNLE